MNKAAKSTLYNWFSFYNRDISNKYMITVRNKFDTLQEISKIFQMKNTKTLSMEAAADCIPTKLRAKCRVPWETQTVWKKQDNVKQHTCVIKKNQLILKL